MTNNNEGNLGEWFQSLLPYQWHFRLAIAASIFFVVLCLSAAAKQADFFITLFKSDTVPSEISAQKIKDPTAKPAISFASAKNLFGRVKIKQEAVVVKTNLQLNGIIMSDDPDDRAAIIAEKNKPEEIYRLNDKVPGGATLKEVHTDHAIISRNGTLEKLLLNLEATGQAAKTRPAARKRSTRRATTPSRQPQKLDYKKFQGQDFQKFQQKGSRQGLDSESLEQFRSRALELEGM